MTTVEELPPIPTIKFKEISPLINDLKYIFSRCKGAVVDADLALRWARNVATTMGWDKDLQPVQDTLLQFVGTTVDDKFVNQLAAQMVGRWHELHPTPIVMFRRPTQAGWVLLEIRSQVATIWNSSKGPRSGIELQMLALTGQPAGYTLTRKFPEGWLNHLAYEVGFNRRMTYDGDANHFIGLQFWAWLVPTDDGFEFESTAVPDKLRKVNAEIIKLRTRFDYDKAECPFNYEHYCWQCPASKDQCIASCRLTNK